MKPSKRDITEDDVRSWFYTATPKEKRVDEKEFYEYVDSYPRYLEKEVCGSSEYYNDYYIADLWMLCVVARVERNENKASYFVVENYEELWLSKTGNMASERYLVPMKRGGADREPCEINENWEDIKKSSDDGAYVEKYREGDTCKLNIYGKDYEFTLIKMLVPSEIPAPVQQRVGTPPKPCMWIMIPEKKKQLPRPPKTLPTGRKK